MEQQQVEGVEPGPREAPLGRHPQVSGVAALVPQAWIGEAGEAARTVALPFIEVVADGPHHAEAVAIAAAEGPPQHPVGFALAIHVRGDHRANRLVGPDQRREPLVIDRRAEAHEPATAPGADGDRAGIDRGARSWHRASRF